MRSPLQNKKCWPYLCFSCLTLPLKYELVAALQTFKPNKVMTFFQPLFVGTTLYFGASTLKFDNKNAQHAKVRFNRCDIGEKFQFTQKFGQTFIVCVSEGAKL